MVSLQATAVEKELKNPIFQHCRFQVMTTNNLTQPSSNVNNYLHYEKPYFIGL